MLNLSKHRLHQSVSARYFSPLSLPQVYALLELQGRHAAGAQGQSQSRNEPAISTFSGKILLQNGERFILRDDANEVWFHLDDQKYAGKFLGKNVSVTGVLDPLTDTIRVRSIIESNA